MRASTNPGLRRLPGSTFIGVATSDGTVAFANRYSLAFDGVNESLNLGNHYHLARTDARTWSWWMKVTDYANYNGILNDLNSSNSPLRGVEIYINQTSGVLIFSLFGSDTQALTVSTNAAVGTHSWDHWAVVKGTGSTAADITIYKNGSAVATTTSNDTLTSASTAPSTNTIIGGFPSGATTGPFKGYLDEFSYFDAALSAGNITTLYNSGLPGDISICTFYSNCLFWYRMGDYAGDSISSIVNVKNPGTYDATPSNMESGDIQGDIPYTSTAAATNGLSLSFDGINKRLNLGDNLHISSDSQEVTFSWWMKVDDYSDYRTIAADEDVTGPNYKGFSLYTNATQGRLTFQIYNGVANEAIEIRSTSAVGTGTWAHYAVVKTAGTGPSSITLYKDGAVMATSTVNNALPSVSASTSNFLIGASPSGAGVASLFKGKIDEFIVFDTALSALDVANLSVGGKPALMSSSFPAYDLHAVLHLRMGDNAGDSASTIVNQKNPGTYNATGVNLVSGDIQSDVP